MSQFMPEIFQQCGLFPGDLHPAWVLEKSYFTAPELKTRISFLGPSSGSGGHSATQPGHPARGSAAAETFHPGHHQSLGPNAR